MTCENIKHSVLDDGSIFETQEIKIPGVGVLGNVLVVNASIEAKARALLASAKAMHEAKKTRLRFLRASRESLSVDRGSVYASAENEAWQAGLRLRRLEMLSAGQSVADKVAVSLEDWVALLSFFEQKTDVGSIKIIGGRNG